MVGVKADSFEERFFKRGLAVRIYDTTPAYETWQFRDESKTIPAAHVDVSFNGSYCLAKWKDVCRAASQ